MLGPMRIGRYEVVRELKGGGMGSVTLCKSPDGALVVLKRPYSPDPDAAVRLRDEARLGARLLHPAIVDTLDFFEDRGLPVLVIAYVDGLSLENLREQGPLPAGAVARIGRQIAEALDALHLAKDENGNPLHILHRDVTPGNIVVDRWGDAKLIDLGIARFADRQAERTQVGFLRGTMRYLAPELIHGDSYSAASDLWSLGLVLWEAALGRYAYPVEGDREVLAGILRGEPMELFGGEKVDDALRAAIATLLEIEPEKRVTRAVEAAFRFAEIEPRFGDSRAQTAAAVQRAVKAKESLEGARRALEAARRSGEFDALPPTEAEVQAAPPRLASLSVDDPSSEATRGEPFPPHLSDEEPSFSLPPTEPEVALLAPDAARTDATQSIAVPAPVSFLDGGPVLPPIDAGDEEEPTISMPVLGGAEPIASTDPDQDPATSSPAHPRAAAPAPVPEAIAFDDAALRPTTDPFTKVPQRDQPSPEVTLTSWGPPPALDEETEGADDPYGLGDDDDPSSISISASFELPSGDPEPSVEVAMPSAEADATVSVPALPDPLLEVPDDAKTVSVAALPDPEASESELPQLASDEVQAVDPFLEETLHEDLADELEDELDDEPEDDAFHEVTDGAIEEVLLRSPATPPPGASSSRDAAEAPVPLPGASSRDDAEIEAVPLPGASSPGKAGDTEVVPLPGALPPEPRARVEAGDTEAVPLPGAPLAAREREEVVPLPGLSPSSLERTQVGPLLTLPSGEVLLVEPPPAEPPSLDDGPRPHQHARVEIDAKAADAAAGSETPWLTPEDPAPSIDDDHGEPRVLKLRDVVSLMDDD